MKKLCALMSVAMLLAQRLVAGDPILIGSHPVSVLTPFPALHTLKAHEGRIYMGYGDWNDYPVAVVASFDPSRDAFRVEYSAPTDSLDNFRSIGGKLYAPSIDPIHYEGFQDFSVREGGRWRSFSPGGFLHVFDIGTVNGSDLWLVGSKTTSETVTADGGAVMRSLDSGRTWEDVTPIGQNYGRFYYGFALQGRFYVQGYVYDGGTVSALAMPYLILQTAQISGGDEPFIVGLSGREPGSSDSSSKRLVTFDGADWRTLHSTVQNFTVTDSTLYALISNQVWQVSFQSVTQAVWGKLPITAINAARSIEVMEGVCYVGDAAGQLWAARLDGTAPIQNPIVITNELRDAFGRSMAWSEKTLAVGSPEYSGDKYLSGRVTLWDQSNSAWTQVAVIDPPLPNLSGWFGSDVALYGEFMAILESGRDLSGSNRGSAAQVHLYQRDASGWVFRQGLSHPFAHSIALEGNLLAVATTASLHVYRLAETNGVLAALEASLSHNAPVYEPVGRVAIDGDRIAYGVSGDISRSGGPGQVNIYERNVAGGWSLVSSLRQDTPPLPVGLSLRPDAFGFAVSLKNGWLAVGAPRDDTVAAQAGMVHLYERTPTANGYTYQWRQSLPSPVPQPEARFGAAVSLTETRLLVGAPGVDMIDRQYGRVFVYELEGAGWVAAGELPAPSESKGEFGWEVLATSSHLFAGCNSSGDAPGLAERVSIVTNPDVSRSVDLAVTLGASPSIITNESLVTYSILVTNRGPASASLVGLTFNRFGSLQIESIESSGFACTNTGTEVSCNLEQLPVGGSEVIKIHARTNLSGPCLLVHAEVAAYSHELDLNIADNRAEVVVSSPPPQLTLTSPTEGTNVTVRGSVLISASIASAYPVSSVSIRANNNLLKSFTAPPYTFLWTNVSLGTHQISVRAFDACGVSAVASTLVYGVANQPPVVTLLSPIGGTRFSNTNSIPIYVSAIDPEGGRTLVEIYRDFVRARIIRLPPYTYMWTNVSEGIHAVHAVAYDLSLAATTSAVARIYVGPELSPGTNWIAFNDHGAGPATGSNVTRWDILGSSPGGGGTLRSSTNGASLPVWLAITRSPGTFFGGPGSNPSPDSPAARIFGGKVDFATGSAANVGISSPGWVRYEFRGLDPNIRYHLRGTAIGGNVDYTNRWTLVELIDSRGSQAAHSSGCLMEGVGSIRSNQVALNTGFNLVGETVGWNDIHPSRAGTVAIVCSQYSGEVPGGSSGGSVGYALTAIRLEEVNDHVAPPPGIVRSPANITTSPGADAGFSVFANGAGPFNYQWLRDGIVLPTATNDALEIESVSTNDVGRFAVVVTGETGSAVSQPGVLSLLSVEMRTNDFSAESLARLTVLGPTSQRYSAEFSDSLGLAEDWNLLTNFTLVTNKAVIDDRDVGSRTNRFYRVLPRP